ncbi:MAG: 16S rRNA (guanine(527)-N(7))-methyltransferase RsmG [Bacteroidota bacterium]
MNNDQIWLHTLCKKNGIIITDIQLDRLSSFRDLLLEWNKKINLVSRKNEDNLWKGHIALSLSLLFTISFQNGSKILDLGTGGGFPGIPLAIMLPECTFVLLDSTQKKITAVQSMADALTLTNVRTIWGRAEEVGKRSGLHSSFDAVVARSVSNLTNLLDWGLPFLKSGNGKNTATEKVFITRPSLITFKGTEIEQEEILARQKHPEIHLHHRPLLFKGSEEFERLEKKITIATRL